MAQTIIAGSPFLRNARALGGKPIFEGGGQTAAAAAAETASAVSAATETGAEQTTTSTNYGRSKQAQAASAIDSAGQASRAGKRRTENTLLTGADGAMPANSQLGRTTLLGA